MSSASSHGVRVGTTSVLARSGVAMDRVRWGPVVAGLFVALATLAVLATLGVAVGFSAADRNDSASAFGIGAGIWGAASALIAFFIGGLVAARTAATPITAIDTDGHIKNDNGLLQGAMVWAVATVLTTYLVASTAGSVIGSTGRALGSGVQAAATSAKDAVANSDAAKRVANSNDANEAVDNAKAEATAATQKATDAAKDLGNKFQGQIQEARKQVEQTLTPENMEAAAGYGAKASWGLLGSMVLGLIAAAVGGLIGGKTRSATVTVQPAA